MLNTTKRFWALCLDTHMKLALYKHAIIIIIIIICGVLCGKWQARESTGMFGNLMAIYYIMPQFIQNHSRFVMLMKTCMIS